jgi:signal transduction histidine kinase
MLMVLVGLGGGLLENDLYINWWPAYVLLLLGTGLPTGLVGQIFLTFPTGRFQDGFDRSLMYAVYASVLLAGVLGVVFAPAGPACPSCVTAPFGHAPNVGAETLVTTIFDAVGSVALLVFVARIARRWIKGTPVARRVMAPVVWAVVPTFTLTLAKYELMLNPSATTTLVTLQLLSFSLLPIGFLVGLLRMRLDRSAVGAVAIELGGSATPETVEASLRRAFHDPSLTVQYWVPAFNGYRDGTGQIVGLDPRIGRRIETVTNSNGENLAAVTFDDAAGVDPQLVKGSLMVARLALENARLQAEVKAQLVDVRASRKRLLEAGDAERRRIERNLHDGAQQRLVTLSLGIKLAREEALRMNDRGVVAMLDESGDELTEALEELRELARGIHPAVLTEAGLAQALRALGERCRLPVVVSVPSDLEALNETAAATLYFVASEALANATKHSHAATVMITVTRLDRRVCLEVRDNGIGGARLVVNSGLRGLSDRVAAAGGTLRVTSPPDAGTTVLAEVPCD